MPLSFLSAPIKEGVLPQLGADDQVVFLGEDRLLFLERSGNYRISRIDTSLRKGKFIIEPSLNKGVWHSRPGQVLWVGGDILLDYIPRTGKWFFLRYRRGVTRGDPFTATPCSSVNSLPPDLKLVYLGRDRLLGLNSKGKPHYLFDTQNLPHTWPLGNPFLLPRPFLSLGRQSLEPPTFAWLGGDRLLYWNKNSGAGYTGRYSQSITPLETFRSGLQNYHLGYIGQNRVLMWQPGTAHSSIREVLFNSLLNLKIDDYLELHHNVRNSISWQENGSPLPYREWDLHPGSASFYVNLDKFYGSIAAGNNVPLVFQQHPDQAVAPVAGIAPGLYGSYMSHEDASQIFLAHVAQSLWVELTRRVSWRLHKFSGSQLALLLQSATMFKEGTAANNAAGLYLTYDSSGNGTPGDPTKSYRFLAGTDPGLRSGPSFIKSTPRETIFELFRWIRDHLHHGANIVGGAEGLAAYGYGGPPPIEKMFTRVTDPNRQSMGPRYWAWLGCHGAAALVFWLLHAVNIPCLGYRTYIEDNPNPLHHGLDFPSERLFSAHLDDFYAVPKLLDPAIEPSEVFESDQDYDTLKQRYLSAPAAGEIRQKPHDQALARKGLAHPTYNFVSCYWEQLIYPNNNIFGPELIANGFDAADIPAISAQYSGILQAAIDLFKQQHGLQNTPEEDAWAAYKAAYKTWDDNR